MAIWGKPANIPLPEGWREYEPLRGRMAVGQDIADNDLGVIGRTGGEKMHRLTNAEMPLHTHNYNDIYYSEAWGTVYLPGSIGSEETDYDNKGYDMTRTSAGTGGDQPHNNMPPYRVVQFIEYVGF